MPSPAATQPRLGSIAVVAVVAALAGCSAAATAAPSTPAASAIVEHSAMPSESMMEHSASPSVAAPVSKGTFHGVDGTATGTVALFHNADGTFTITFEDFSISSAAGTHVVLLPNKDVTKDGDVDKTTLVDLGPLTGTSGMQDFKVPATADAMTFHTVVLWDTGMAHAIAAAPLQ